MSEDLRKALGVHMWRNVVWAISSMWPTPVVCTFTSPFTAMKHVHLACSAFKQKVLLGLDPTQSCCLLPKKQLLGSNFWGLSKGPNSSLAKGPGTCLKYGASGLLCQKMSWMGPWTGMHRNSDVWVKSRLPEAVKGNRARSGTSPPTPVNVLVITTAHHSLLKSCNYLPDCSTREEKREEKRRGLCFSWVLLLGSAWGKLLDGDGQGKLSFEGEGGML